MPSFTGVSDPPVYWKQLREAKGIRAFDIGANGGRVSRMFAENFGHVVAFEPGPSYADLDAFRTVNMTCVEAAISDHDGTVTLEEASESIQTGQLVTGNRLNWGTTVAHVDVPCMTLDSAVREYGVPDLVKIDVEGHEVQVLAGATRTLALYPRLMIEVHSRTFGLPIWRYLRDAGYDRPEIIRHPGYEAGSDMAVDHFYLVTR